MLSEALRLLRVFHDLKQKDLAVKLGISQALVSELEKGNRTPSLDVVQKYADFFRVPVSSIMFFSENIATAQQGRGGESRVQTAIASKIINFLKMIETKAELDEAT